MNKQICWTLKYAVLSSIPSILINKSLKEGEAGGDTADYKLVKDPDLNPSSSPAGRSLKSSEVVLQVSLSLALYPPQPS